MYMEEFTNKTNIYKAKTFGTTQKFIVVINFRKCEAAVRASLYMYNTEEEAKKFVDMLGKTIGLFNP